MVGVEAADNILFGAVSEITGSFETWNWAARLFDHSSTGTAVRSCQLGADSHVLAQNELTLESPDYVNGRRNTERRL